MFLALINFLMLGSLWLSTFLYNTGHRVVLSLAEVGLPPSETVCSAISDSTPGSEIMASSEGDIPAPDVRPATPQGTAPAQEEDFDDNIVITASSHPPATSSGVARARLGPEDEGRRRPPDSPLLDAGLLSGRRSRHLEPDGDHGLPEDGDKIQAKKYSK